MKIHSWRRQEDDILTKDLYDSECYDIYRSVVSMLQPKAKSHGPSYSTLLVFVSTSGEANNNLLELSGEYFILYDEVFFLQCE